MILLSIASKHVLVEGGVVHIDKAMMQVHLLGQRDAAREEPLCRGVHPRVVFGVRPAEIEVHEHQWAVGDSEAQGVAAVAGHLVDDVQGDGLEGEGGEEAWDGEDGVDFFDEDVGDHFDQGGGVFEGCGAEGFA